jgi:hypothetical protein
MKNATTYVGLDAHKKDIYVAMLVGHDRVPVAWQLPNEPQAIRRLVRKLKREAAGPIECCYEAGPCGYALQRQLRTERVSCQVVAPAPFRVLGFPGNLLGPFLGRFRSIVGRIDRGLAGFLGRATSLLGSLNGVATGDTVGKTDRWRDGVRIACAGRNFQSEVPCEESHQASQRRGSRGCRAHSRDAGRPNLGV